jgi:hypothetical protein
MKRTRKMLLSVTAASMAAVVVGCATTQPVGTVSRPPDDQPVADAAVSPDVDQQPAAQDHTVGTVAHPPDKK